MRPICNCGRIGDLESLCSLTSIRVNVLPHLLKQHPEHELAKMDIAKAAYAARGLAAKGDPLCRTIFKIQAHSLGLFFDEMINTFDPDALIIGGGVLEARKNSGSGLFGRFVRACRSSALNRLISRSM